MTTVGYVYYNFISAESRYLDFSRVPGGSPGMELCQSVPVGWEIIKIY